MTTLLFSLALAPVHAAPPASCPEGWRLESNGWNRLFCITDGFEVPQANLTPYCHYIDDGYVGFHWLTLADPDYVCPDGTRQTTNGAELSFCLWEDLDIHTTDAKPYCETLEEGVVGYLWQPQTVIEAPGLAWMCHTPVDQLSEEARIVRPLVCRQR